jgi:hypothetical protein
MTIASDLLATDFATLPDLIRAHARERGSSTAIADSQGSIDYATRSIVRSSVA